MPHKVLGKLLAAIIVALLVTVFLASCTASKPHNPVKHEVLTVDSCGNLVEFKLLN